MKNLEGVHYLGQADSFRLFGENCAMQRNSRVHLDAGTRIAYCGFGMCETPMIIVDDDMNACAVGYDGEELTENSVNGDWSVWKHKVDETIRPYSQQFGIGVYYYDDDQTEMATPEEIAHAVARAERLDQLKAEYDEKCRKEDEQDKQRCIKDYPYLTRIDTIKDYKEKRRIAGKNIRTELQHHFPGWKFSVRYSSYSGGDNYDIEWEDGPQTKEVDAVVKKFQTYAPDSYSMGDYWDPIQNNFADFYGGAHYVMTRREMSDAAIERAHTFINEHYPHITEDNFKERWIDINEMDKSPNCSPYSFYEVCRWLAWDMEKYTKPAEKTQQKPSIEPINGDFKIIDYSEKAIAVVGDTRAFKDELKKLGGRFNPKLTCGAGWIFPKTKHDELKRVLQIA